MPRTKISLSRLGMCPRRKKLDEDQTHRKNDHGYTSTSDPPTCQQGSSIPQHTHARYPPSCSQPGNSTPPCKGGNSRCFCSSSPPKRCRADTRAVQSSPPDRRSPPDTAPAPGSSHPVWQRLRLLRRLRLSSSTLRCKPQTLDTALPPHSSTPEGTASVSPRPRDKTTPSDTSPHSSDPAHVPADARSSACHRLPSSYRTSQPANPPPPHCNSTLHRKPPWVPSAPRRRNTFPLDSSSTARCWQTLCGCCTSHLDTCRPPDSPAPPGKSAQQDIQSPHRHSPPHTLPPCPPLPQTPLISLHWIGASLRSNALEPDPENIRIAPSMHKTSRLRSPLPPMGCK